MEHSLSENRVAEDGTIRRDDDLDACRRRIEAADAQRYEDPQAALTEAQAARDAAADLDRAVAGDGPWLRLQALAWGVLASAYRNNGDFHRAESSLAVALTFLGEIRGGDLADEEPDLGPQLALRAAYLRCDQGRFDEALQLNREAVESFRALGDEHLVGCALVDRALVLHRSGRTDQAIQVLAQAVERIDRQRDPRCCLAAVHNMAVYLQRSARTETELKEALHWLRLAMAEHDKMPTRLHQLKLRSLAALCRASLSRASGAADGERERARAELTAVRHEFHQTGATSHEAVILLHQAQLAVEDGDEDELARLAGEVFPLASRLPKDEAARGELLAFHGACGRRAVSVALLAEAVARIEDRR